MSGNFVRDNCRLIGRRLTTTTNTTIHTATGYTQLIGVRVANVTGADAVATISYYSVTDNAEYRLLFQHVVGGNRALWLPTEAFGLSEGDQIRVQAGTANALDVILSITETPGRSG